MNDKQYTISIFDRFRHRSNKRLYDLLEIKENVYLEWVMTVTSIWAYFIGIGVLPTPMFEKYKLDMDLLQPWIEERFGQEFIENDDVRFYRNSVIGVHDEIMVEERNLREILDTRYVSDEMALLGTILTKHYMPKEYIMDSVKLGMDSLAEYSDYMKDQNRYDLENKYEKALYDCITDMSRIAHSAWTEYIDAD